MSLVIIYYLLYCDIVTRMFSALIFILSFFFKYELVVMESKEKITHLKDTVIPEDDREMTEDDREIKRVDRDVSISFDDIEKVAIDSRITRSKRSKSLDPTHKLDGFDPIKLKRRISSIMSLGDLIGDAILTDSYGQVKNGKWQKIVDFLDLTLFKDPIYLNIILGNTFALYSDSAFFTLLPMYLFTLGFEKVLKHSLKFIIHQRLTMSIQKYLNNTQLYRIFSITNNKFKSFYNN